MPHTPVLLNQVVVGLNPQAGETYLDATIGSGGHALAIAQALGPGGRIIGLDQDPSSLAQAKAALSGVACQVDLAQSNFRELDAALAKLGVGEVNLSLFDLGVHSDQFGPSGRGFSFLHDEPLLMSMGEESASGLTARDIVNSWAETDLKNVLVGYGEEQFAAAIAAAIVATRRDQPIETTFQLVKVINSAVPKWYQHKKIHPATKTFQALRLAVNDELDALREGLSQAWLKLAPSGRLGVTSFHSLEARIVKEYFKQLTKGGEGELVNKHAIKPAWAETRENPRSRSAQLRIIKKF